MQYRNYQPFAEDDRVVYATVEERTRWPFPWRQVFVYRSTTSDNFKYLETGQLTDYDTIERLAQARRAQEKLQQLQRQIEAQTQGT